jgi:glycosyltransferase involved in cell wall biosynthesis
MDSQLNQSFSLARDKALIGNYYEAIMEYDNYIACLNRLLRQGNAGADLHELKREINEEVKIEGFVSRERIIELYSQCGLFVFPTLIGLL